MPTEEFILETQGSNNNNSNDLIKDKDEFPHDSDPALRNKKKEESIDNNPGTKPFNDENTYKKIKESALSGNAYEVQIVDNMPNNEIQEEEQHEEEQQEEEHQEEENKQNEEVNVNIPISDNNIGELVNNENPINNNEQIVLNNIGLARQKNLENMNLNVIGMQNYNNYNQINENGGINNFYEQNGGQQNFTDINLNQYNINIDNNQINYNSLSAANSNINFTAEEEANLNNINLFNSEFTFGEPQQLKDSIDSYANQVQSPTYNYDYYSSEDNNKLY